MDTKEKHKLIKRLLLDEYLIVQINNSTEGLLLPEALKKDHSVSLKLSKLFRGPILLKEDRIEANLSFNKAYFNCIIPLTAIWSVTSIGNEFTVWPESAPIEYLKSIINQAAATSAEPEVKKGEAAKTSKSDKENTKRRPVLKRIK